MEIIRVKEKDAFVPLAIQIEEDWNVDFVSEICMNTYPGDGYASRRGKGAIGEGIVDVAYGNGDRDYVCIRPGETGWLVLDEHMAHFYPGETLWREYDRLA